MIAHAVGWVLLFVLVVVLLWATTGGPVGYDDAPEEDE